MQPEMMVELFISVEQIQQKYVVVGISHLPETLLNKTAVPWLW